MAKSIPTVSADHPAAAVALKLALLKRAADRIADRRTEAVRKGLETLAAADSGSLRTPYGVIGRRAGRRTVTVTDPVVMARIEELEAKINKMRENALAQGKAVESYGSDTVALTGATLPD